MEGNLNLKRSPGTPRCKIIYVLQMEPTALNISAGIMSGDGHWEDSNLWQEFAMNHPEFARVNIEDIEHVSTAARNDIACTITRFTYGVHNAVFEVTFEDAVVWICRVHDFKSNVSPACVKAKIESTVATMHYIQSHDSSIPIPMIYSFESDPLVSIIGHGYILMEAMGGMEVDTDELTDEEEIQVYSQLARVVWQLSRICLPKIGRIYQSSNEFYVGPFIDSHGSPYGPFNTSVEFFKYEASKIPDHHKTWRINSPDDDKKSMIACSLYEQAASRLSDYDTGSFPIAHGDFDTHNALFERDAAGKLQLSAVLDWDSAQTVTWLEFCFFPNFLSIRWPAFEAGKYSQHVLQNIKRQQCIFVQALRQLECGNKSSDLDSPPCRPSPLYNLFDSAPVRVAELLLKYSNPRYQCNEELLRKYLTAWRTDLEIASNVEFTNSKVCIH